MEAAHSWGGLGVPPDVVVLMYQIYCVSKVIAENTHQVIFTSGVPLSAKCVITKIRIVIKG